MEVSDTYLMIVDEGYMKGARETILIVGEVRFGPADECFREQLSAITDIERLKRMLRRAVKAASWQEVLATP